MSESDKTNQAKTFTDPGELPGKALVIMVVAAALIGVWFLTGSGGAIFGVLMVVATDGVMAALVLLAAGGYGYVIFRWLAPPETPGLLALATSAAAGLWLLSTAVMVVGSTITGALTVWVWWPVVGVGVVLALIQAHRAMGKISLPGKYRGGALVWVLVAVGAGMWLAGAAMPPGLLGQVTADFYDVLEYHLQLPREYHQAGSVSTLTHNVYSHYPLGSEMLYLLGMCLRGGAHEGVYLAKLTNGLFAIIAIVGVFGALRAENDFSARATAAILASAPVVLYFSWVAMSELSQICYLALGLLWLRQWLARPAGRSALWLGAMAGAACAMKYLSIGLIAGPVLVVMLIASVRRARRLGQVALATAVTAALFSPWLVRNVAATGNPVFPLATGLFGAAHWSEDSAQRWRDGHSPRRPTVSEQIGEQVVPRQLSRREAAGRLLLGLPPYHTSPILDPAHLLKLLTLGALFAMFLHPRSSSGWEWSLAGVLLIQFVVWAQLSHNMPARFIAIAVVPLAMLTGRALGKLSNVKEFRLGRWRQSGGIAGRWGLAPAGLLLVAVFWTNLPSARAYFGRERVIYAMVKTLSERPLGHPPKPSAEQREAPGQSTVLVGEATAFWHPPGTVYATVFDTHPLEAAFAQSTSPEEMLARLREIGITRVEVRWSEVNRLAGSYGWPDVMAPDRIAELLALCPAEHLYNYRTDEQGNLMTDEQGNPIRGRPAVTIFAVPAPTTPAE